MLTGTASKELDVLREQWQQDLRKAIEEDMYAEELEIEARAYNGPLGVFEDYDYVEDQC